MKSSFKEIPNLSKDWDFWFAHTKKLPTKEKQKKESYYFILNSETSEIDYVSNDIAEILGYSKEEFNIEKLFSIIHPDDLSYCRDCEYDGMQISNDLQYNEHFRYSFHYSYRIKAKNDTYITIKQQYRAIDVDEQGHLLQTIVIHERIEDYKTRPLDDFKIIDSLKGRPINLPSKFKLSKRELQILELVYKGYKSEQISEMLYLSKHTISTHRKNILQKTKASSWLDLVNK